MSRPEIGAPLDLSWVAGQLDKITRRYGIAPDRVRMHPETQYRLMRSRWGGYIGAAGPADFLMGIPATIDSAVPDGIVRAEFDLAPGEDVR